MLHSLGRQLNLYLLYDMMPAGVIDEQELAAAVDTIISGQRMNKVSPTHIPPYSDTLCSLGTAASEGITATAVVWQCLHACVPAGYNNDRYCTFQEQVAAHHGKTSSLPSCDRCL
jgi:hypothetical protein